AGDAAVVGERSRPATGFSEASSGCLARRRSAGGGAGVGRNAFAGDGGGGGAEYGDEAESCGEVSGRRACPDVVLCLVKRQSLHDQQTTDGHSARRVGSKSARGRSKVWLPRQAFRYSSWIYI